MIKLASKEEQMSAVDELIRQRGIETDSTRFVDQMAKDMVDVSREKVIELCNLSKENLQNQIDATIVEILIDDCCDDDCKALTGKIFQLKNNIFNTQKRIDAITAFVEELERSDDNGPRPEAD
jgi:hypothetical protein